MNKKSKKIKHIFFCSDNPFHRLACPSICPIVFYVKSYVKLLHFSVCTFTLHDLSLAHGVLGAFFCSSKISIFINNFLDMSIGGRTDG